MCWLRRQPNTCALVFGLDLKCLVLWQLLLLTCAAPTHAQKYLGKNTFIYLFVSPIDAGSQKCTQGTPSVKGRKQILFEMGKLIFEIRAQVLCKHLCSGIERSVYLRYFIQKTSFDIPSWSLLTHVRLPSKPAYEPSNGPKLPVCTVCALVL